MSKLELRLLGRFCAQRETQSLRSLDISKVQELFAYLLVHRRRAHGRKVLAALLWGDSSETQAQKYLRQALWQLQSTFDPQRTCSEPVLLVEVEWVRINPAADLWLDIAAFENAFAQVRGEKGDTLAGSVADEIADAIGLYRGEFLEGCYQDWCLYERERLQRMYLSMLDKLIRYSEVHENYEAGIALCEQVLVLDRARERTHRQLIRLYSLAGDRSEALRQYERCRLALKEELDVEPSRQTALVYQQVRMDCSSSSPAARAAGSSALADLLSRLYDLGGSLDSLHLQLNRIIQAVDPGPPD